jgi:hypothetical protein
MALGCSTIEPTSIGEAKKRRQTCGILGDSAIE